MTNVPEGAAIALDRKAMFDYLRRPDSAAFGRPMTESQVQGVEAIVDEGLRRGTARNLLADKLATAYHETARTMQPIHEKGARAYFNKYEPGTRIGKMLGNTRKGDGYLFRGRGLPQLTGRRNYELASGKLGVDLVSNPDLALEPQYAIPIMFDGMTDGWFTGRKLSDYIDDVDEDDAEDLREFIEARRVVNGTDKARLIGSYALTFERALAMAHYPVTFAPAAPLPAGADEQLTVRQIMDIQERLRALGYHEVGAVDGIEGSNTANAILIFRKDHGLPLSTRIDSALRDALMKATPREVAPDRAAAPASEVREQAPEAKASWWSKIIALWSFVTMTVGGFFNWLITNFSAVRDQARPILDFFGLSKMPMWGLMLAFAAIAGAVWFMSRKAEKKTVEAYQAGERR